MKKTKSLPVEKEPVLSKWLEFAMLIMFGVYLFLLTSYKAAGDDDMFWHLSTGRYIAEHKTVPSADVFGWLTDGKPWIPIEWAWDTLTYITYTAYSFEGLSVLRSIIVLAMFFMLYLTLKRLKLPASVIIISLLILSIGLFERYTIRPHLVSYLFTAVFLYLIIRIRQNPEQKLLYYFPVITLIWVNFHQGVYFGLLLFALYIIYEAIEVYILKTREGGFTKKLLLFFGISLLCLLITPHAYNTILYTYNHANMKMLDVINEWKSPFDAVFATNYDITLYKYFLYAGVVVLVYSLLRKDYFPLAVCLCFGVISTTGIRFITDYEIISSVFIFSSLYYLIAERKNKKINMTVLFKPALVYVIIALMIFASYNIPSGKLYSDVLKEYKAFGLGIDRDFYPVKMFDFVKANKINEKGQRVFNHYGVGGMFSWYFPAQKNFIDSRNLNDEIFYTYDSLDYITGNYAEILNRLGIDYAMYYVPDLLSRPEVMDRILVSYFSTHADEWKLVYWDDVSFVFVKNTPAFAEITGRLEYKYITPYNFGYRRQYMMDGMKSDTVQFAKELERKFTEDRNGMLINMIVPELKKAY